MVTSFFPQLCRTKGAFETYSISQHTIDVVLRVIAGESVNLPIGWTPPSGIQTGEKLWLAHEFQNPYDSQALILNTEDHYIVGYCPRDVRTSTQCCRTIYQPQVAISLHRHPI